VSEHHGSFVRTCWSRLASLAWQCYSAYGRGALHLSEQDMECWQERAASATVAYVSEGSRALEALGGWPSVEVAALVREYNPLTQIICIVSSAGRTAVHLVTADGDAYPHPPGARFGEEGVDPGAKRLVH
jgi:hypothetical protein